MEFNTILSCYFCQAQGLQSQRVSETQFQQQFSLREQSTTLKHNAQFIQKILAHESFSKINHKLTINSSALEPLEFINEDYVNLICAENRQNNLQLIETKMQALSQLDNAIYEVQMLSQGLDSKQAQLKRKIDSYNKREKQFRQEEQIVAYENSKLEKQLSELSKRRGKQRLTLTEDRIQNISPNSSEECDEQSRILNAQKQLEQILSQFNCPNGFPKNKTEALMLINRIEGQIQKIELEQLNRYSIQDALKQ